MGRATLIARYRPERRHGLTRMPTWHDYCDSFHDICSSTHAGVDSIVEQHLPAATCPPMLQSRYRPSKFFSEYRQDADQVRSSSLLASLSLLQTRVACHLVCEEKNWRINGQDSRGGGGGRVRGLLLLNSHYSLHPNTFSDPDMVRGRICKCLWSPGIYSEESISPGWESILGLLKRSTNTGSGCGGEGEDAESKKNREHVVQSNVSFSYIQNYE